jgi:myosin heavy subunit
MSLTTSRSSIERLTKDKANLERDVAREREKMARLQSEISSITRSITNSTSSSSLQSKQRQIDTKQKEAAQCQKKVADLESKIASKITELNRILKNLEQAEEQERKKREAESKKREVESKKREAESKKRRDEELRHAQTVTRETEKQVRLHTQMKNSRLIIDLARLPETIKVLFMASNPIDQTQLRLDEEIREITEKIRASKHRDSVQLISCWAARPSDLLQALNEHKPHIVHFSGHGSKNDELVFQSDDGGTKLVSKEAIVATMSTLSDNIRVVIFNACFSDAQAEAVTQHIDVAIGMKDAIRDDAAKVFAAQFYAAIGFGRSIKQAFDQGIAALLLKGIPEADIPTLFMREDIEAEEIILVRPETQFSVLPHPNTLLERTHENF